ncbi:hypothetical protein EZV62_000531 [Acer yangbiense]|uniref:Uncharacterized protein n=1 Tax=Acer yangbiense TaxID=1000413 RepID=A0A5C7IU32_9ROSI|nr:hypothetical protein EZV62_000531 [Acer yangbiense]
MYSTRQSTRLLEKTMKELSLKERVHESVKVDDFNETEKRDVSVNLEKTNDFSSSESLIEALECERELKDDVKEKDSCANNDETSKESDEMGTIDVPVTELTSETENPSTDVYDEILAKDNKTNESRDVHVPVSESPSETENAFVEMMESDECSPKVAADQKELEKQTTLCEEDYEDESLDETEERDVSGNLEKTNDFSFGESLIEAPKYEMGTVDVPVTELTSETENPSTDVYDEIPANDNKANESGTVNVPVSKLTFETENPSTDVYDEIPANDNKANESGDVQVSVSYTAKQIRSAIKRIELCLLNGGANERSTTRNMNEHDSKDSKQSDKTVFVLNHL